ncbi:hypothetical protein H8N03_16610 [Ramlibacter sp. USB13]|uniref:Uncharacterized protein n=1 Tax=Ramlibacter cellulosilyticus TaxID=2764187 RepID=A0A923SG49_9BURK|nr:hypothetical protein [Ramlibacter cellulosilyticus]MBC5784572.1 hypothetical protein [Ramlibacter cellulosilyticus]
MSTSPTPDSPQVEAARYALLRRLAPSMRHHLVVNLQPIGMIYEVMDRRLRAPTPDIAHLQDSAGKINGFAKAALASCIDVVGWLAPDDTVGVSVPDAVRECAALLATSFSFRGYALRNEVGDVRVQVRRSAIRQLLAATLLHCTDHHPAPAELVLGAAAEEGGVRLSVLVRPTQGDKGIPAEAHYRQIAWEDVAALAGAEGVELVRQGDAVVLRFAAF